MNKPRHLCLLCLLATAFTPWQATAHPWHAGSAEPGVVFDESYRARVLAEFLQDHGDTTVSAQLLVASAAEGPAALQMAAQVVAAAGAAPAQAAPFMAFAPKVNTRWDGDFLYIESNGIPAHNMMVGITAWQQQVPLPQAYMGDNAWRIPLHPVVAKQPASIKNRFLRGAIALAANGIPIFNPQNNRGEVSQEIGELDQWGGHCGRADDYHYHAAPLHLQSIVGKGQPIAFALDGYPIYGLTEPDGSPVGKLDEFHGHETALGYHYHASTKYPYVNGGFHGEVVEAGGQVDPQPRANPVRPPTGPLRGAKITAFESLPDSRYKLSYQVNGDKRSVSYSINSDGTYPFVFDNGSEGKTSEVYTTRRGGGGEQGPGGPQGKGNEDRAANMRKATETQRPSEGRPALIGTMDTNGDGVVSAVEFAEAAKRQFAQGKMGGTLADALQKAKAQFMALDHNKDGVLDAAELEEQASNGPPPNDKQAETPMRTREEPPQGKALKRGGRQEAGKGDAFVASPDQPRSSNGLFMLTSPEVHDLKEMPADYTGDGSGATLPLEWKGAPAGTQGYALIMDHTDPEGAKKWYWTVYDIPVSVTRLEKNAKGVGKVGTGFKGEIGYEPPHSKGPGPKTYVITLYALSAPLNITLSPREVNREILLAALKGRTLASSSLRVVHTSNGSAGAGKSGKDDPPPQGEPKGEMRRGPGLRILPPGAEEKLSLTADQQKQLADVEADEKAKLEKILTPEQWDALKQIRPPQARDGPGGQAQPQRPRPDQ